MNVLFQLFKNLTSIQLGVEQVHIDLRYEVPSQHRVPPGRPVDSLLRLRGERDEGPSEEWSEDR